MLVKDPHTCTLKLSVTGQTAVWGSKGSLELGFGTRTAPSTWTVWQGDLEPCPGQELWAQQLLLAGGNTLRLKKGEKGEEVKGFQRYPLEGATGHLLLPTHSPRARKSLSLYYISRPFSRGPEDPA